MDELRRELKALIVETLKLEDVTMDEIGDDEPLFKDGLGLDSIDALELAVALEQRYRVSIPDQETGKRAFASVSALATFVSDNRQDL
jgi:acyl carrier protein